MAKETTHDSGRLGVAWDLDGVIVDTTELHFRAWSALLAHHGMTLTYDEFLPTFGSRNEEVIPRLWQAHGKSVDPSAVPALSEEKERFFREILPPWVPLLPGVLELMQSLDRHGARQAIATSTPRANLDALLARLPRLPIAATVTAEDVRHGKPAPDVFLQAAGALKIEPERMVVVEDAPQGVEAAHAAGMACLAVSSTRPPEELARAGADRVVTTLVGLTAADVLNLIATRKSSEGVRPRPKQD